LTGYSSTTKNSAITREQVIQARKIQQGRFHKSGNTTNSSMSPREMKVHCQIDTETSGYLEHTWTAMHAASRKGRRQSMGIECCDGGRYQRCAEQDLRK
jgi:predicted ATPase with chaperone activity